MDKENVSAPVISIDALFTTLVIDVATVDTPGAFLQTDAKPGTYMKITGPMVDILLCQTNPKVKLIQSCMKSMLQLRKGKEYFVRVFEHTYLLQAF